jgi:class 3 adenylate cyclase
MRAPIGVYVAVVALAFGLATVVTRLVKPNDNFVASLLDVAFVVLGVGGLELWARRRRPATREGAGTQTFLFSDLEGSTRLLKRLGDTYGATLARQDELLRTAFAAHGGHVVDTQGDAFFVAFGAAREAVEAAVAAERRLLSEPWPDGASVRARIGIHTGRALREGERWHGLAVHRAARICAVARGGEILCSQTTYDLVADEERELEGIEFADAGDHELRDLDRPVRLYRVVYEPEPA